MDPGLDTAVLAAAVDLLAEVGYTRLTMEQVAARAGVSKASLYLRWPNKIALVAHAMQHQADVVPEIPYTGTLAGDMRAFLHALLRGQHQGARALAAINGETAAHPELRQALRAGITGTLVASVRTIVTRAIDRGQIPASTGQHRRGTTVPVTGSDTAAMAAGQRPNPTTHSSTASSHSSTAHNPVRGVRRFVPR